MSGSVMPSAISPATAVPAVVPDVTAVPDAAVLEEVTSTGEDVATPDSSSRTIPAPPDPHCPWFSVALTAVCPPAQLGSTQQPTYPVAPDVNADCTAWAWAKLSAAPPRV